MAVRPGTVTMDIVRTLEIAELPDIRIFRNGRMTTYQAAAGTFDFVDVARWNAGNQVVRPMNMVTEIEGTKELEVALNQHTLVLLAFTTKWCSRCLMLAHEFDAASLLLHSASPPVALATANLDHPANQPLIERFGVLSFPIGKIFHRGRLVGDFMGGTLAHEIVTEMLSIRDDLRRAEEAAEAGLRYEAEQKDEL
jgi:thioredoxin-like negative regulator of GroEL